MNIRRVTVGSRERMPPWPVWLWTLAAVYCAASLAHFAHNAEYIAFYPNMPAGLTRETVYRVWWAISGVGLVGAGVGVGLGLGVGTGVGLGEGVGTGAGVGAGVLLTPPPPPPPQAAKSESAASATPERKTVRPVTSRSPMGMSPEHSHAASDPSLPRPAYACSGHGATRLARAVAAVYRPVARRG